MKKFFTIASALFLATSLSAKVVYVATDGNNSNDGSTWDNAVADIQKAYTLANAGDEIWIAGGTYVMTDGSALLVDMKDQVNVYGSFQKGDASIDARIRPDAVNKPYEFANPTIFTTEGVTLSQIQQTNGWEPFLTACLSLIWQQATVNCFSYKQV